MLFTPAFFSVLFPALLPVLQAAVSGPIASGAPDAAVPGPLPSRSEWQVALSVVSGAPAVLPGLAVGGAFEVSRQVLAGPWFVAGQVGLSSASAANVSWTIDHRQLVVAAGLGARRRFGAASLWAEAGAGTLAIEEVLASHQRERLQTASLPGGTETAFALGAYGFGEVGIDLALRGAVGARLSAGPIVSRIALAGSSSWTLGALTKVGFSYDF